MTALAPAPAITFKDQVDFGVTVADGRLYSKSIVVRNSGSMDASFRLVWLNADGEVVPLSASSPLQIRPMCGVVKKQMGAAPSELKVTFELSATQTAEEYCERIGMVVVGIEGHQTVTVRASIRGHALRIYHQNKTGLGAISELDLGSAYYRTTRTTTATIYNDGPAPVNFLISPTAIQTWTYLPDGSRLLDLPASVDTDTLVSEGILQISPRQGTLQPYCECVVSFGFRPLFGKPQRGWSRQDETPPRRDYSVTLAAAAVGTDICSSLRVSGAGMSPKFTMDKSVLQFAPSAVDDIVEETITVRNMCDHLALSLEIDPVAHFQVEPTKMLILPDEEKTLRITFSPKQIGIFDRKLPLLIAKRSTAVGLGLRAECVNDRRATHRGRSFGLTNTADILKNPTRFYFGLTPGVHSEFSSPSGRQVTGINATANPNAAQLPPVKPSAKPYRGVDPNYGHNFTTTQRLATDKGKYTAFVAESATTRQERTRRHRQNNPAKRDDDGGIGPPPKLTLKKLNGPAKSPRKKSAGTPYKGPQLKLSPEELSKVVLQGKHRIAYGDVCVGSSSSASLEFTNDLDRSVTIGLKTGTQPELSVSPAKTVTVGAGCSCSFQVTLSNVTPSTSIRFSDTLEYVVNGLHRAAIVVGAAIVPLLLNLSAPSVTIAVGSSSRCPKASTSITLENPLGHPAKFFWGLKDTANATRNFSITPMFGEVGPNSTLDCTVELTPNFQGIVNPSTFLLHVEGSEITKSLDCLPKPKGSKCKLKDRIILFGEIGVNRTETRQCTIVNAGGTDAHFEISKLILRPARASELLSVSPHDGIIKAGNKQVLTVTYTPQAAQKFDGSFTVGIGDGKPITVPFSGTCQPSTVNLSKSKLNIGLTVCGSSKRTPFTITNSGKSDATISFNYVNNPAFRLLHAAGPKTHNVVVVAATVALVAPRGGSMVRPGASSESRAPGFAKAAAKLVTMLDAFKLGTEDGAVATSSAAGPAEIPTVVSPKGFVYTVDVAAGESTKMLLECCPTEIAGYDFDTTVLVNGLTAPPVRVCATVTRAMVSVAVGGSEDTSASELEPSTFLDFGTLYTAADGAITTTTKEVALTWNGPEASALLLAEDATLFGDGVVALSVKGIEGQVSLDAPLAFAVGETKTLVLTFQPGITGYYKTRISVTVDGKGASVYRRISMQGFATEPYLSFNTGSVNLPTVAVGVESKASFEMTFHGYSQENTFVRHRAAVESGPVQVTFPAGEALAVGASTLPVDVSFSSASSLGFAHQLEFYDCRGQCFILRATGKTDVSPLTVFDDAANDSMTLVAARWLSSFGLAAPQTIEIPDSMVENCGKTIFDVVVYLAGEEVPGIKLIRPLTMSTGEMLDAFTALLRFLSSRGALVNDIEPSLLLPAERYEEWRRGQHAAMVASGEAYRVTGAVWRAQCAQTSDNHATILRGAWTAVCLQTMKVFVLGRVTDAALQESSAEAQASKACALLGADQNQQRLLIWLNSLQPADSAPVTNFDGDLSDGTVLINTIISFAPWLGRGVLYDTFVTPSKLDERRHNACRVVKALEVLQASDFALHWTDITEPQPSWLMLFVAFLFDALPQYQAQMEAIEFTGSMNSTIKRSITVSNPSKTPLVYKMKMLGSSNFECAIKSVKVPAKGSASVELMCSPKSYQPSEALLYLIGKSGGSNGRATVLTFKLFTGATAAGSAPVARVESKCYELREFVVNVNNPFDTATTFEVAVAEVSAKRASAMAKKSKLTFPTEPAANQKLRAIAFADNQRRSMWPRDQVVSLGPGESKDVSCFFCPTRLGHYRGAVILTSTRFGQSEYVVSGYSSLPAAIGELVWQRESCKPSVTPIVVPYANEQKVASVQRIPEALNPKSTKNMTIATDHVQLFSEKIHFNVDVFGDGQFNFEPFQTPTKLTLDPAEPKRDGDYLATHLTRANLVQIKESTELPVRFDPVASGEYYCKVVLTGTDDIRVYAIAADVAGSVNGANTDTDTAEFDSNVVCVSGEVSSFSLDIPAGSEGYKVLSDLPGFVSGESDVVSAALGSYAIQLEPTADDVGEHTGRFVFIADSAVVTHHITISVAAPLAAE